MIQLAQRQHLLRALLSSALCFRFLQSTGMRPRPEHDWHAGVQIRNTASVGGNIVTGSPISDMNPLYMAARAVFVVGGQGTPEREVSSWLWHVAPSLSLSWSMHLTTGVCTAIHIRALINM